MLELWKFIFSSPWIYFGTVFIIFILGEAISDIVKAFHK